MPDQKPIVACYSDGFTSTTPLLTVFLLSTRSFYLDVKICSTELIDLERQMGDNFQRCVVATVISPDAGIKYALCGGSWFRFESRALARAIIDHQYDPFAAHVMPFGHFISLMNDKQGHKFSGGNSYRTDRPDPSGTVALPRNPGLPAGALPRDRFERLMQQSLRMASDALRSA